MSSRLISWLMIVLYYFQTRKFYFCLCAVVMERYYKQASDLVLIMSIRNIFETLAGIVIAERYIRKYPSLTI